jgi:CelD/BcsL family acetyltransferase involved in cellulose biosynthesis
LASKPAIPDSDTWPPDAAPDRAPEMRAQVVPWRALTDEVAAWDALAAAASEPNPFYESWYLLPSLAALEPGRAVRVFRFEADGQLAGLLPLTTPWRYYRWPIPNLAAWVHANCFLGAPLVAAGMERDFWRALLGWADKNAGQALFLHLRAMPLAGPLHEALAEVLAEQRREAALVHHEERALLEAGNTAEAYFEAALSAKKRKELRRQLARLSELGEVGFDREDGLVGIDRWIANFLVLEAAGWKGRAGSALASDLRTSAVFAQALRGAAECGRLERLAMTLDGRPIAMLATFMTPPGGFAYKTAFDEEYARFSPGVLLQRENLAVLARGDIAWTDSCAAADHPMIDHLWRERRAIGRLSIAIGGKARQRLFARIAAAETGRSGR